MLDPRTHSGLALLNAMIEGALPPPPMADTLDFRLVRADQGEVAFHATPTPRAFNPMGVVHGGWYGALLDSAMGCAVQSTLPPGRLYTTLEYKVNLTRAIPPGTKGEAIGTVQHAGRTTAVARAELRGREDGKLYATASTTCLIFDAP
ncbi:MAG: PaaI family thioesterase [Pseudomonadota bacterium]